MNVIQASRQSLALGRQAHESFRNLDRGALCVPRNGHPALPPSRHRRPASGNARWSALGTSLGLMMACNADPTYSVGSDRGATSLVDTGVGGSAGTDESPASTGGSAGARDSIVVSGGTANPDDLAATSGGTAAGIAGTTGVDNGPQSSAGSTQAGGGVTGTGGTSTSVGGNASGDGGTAGTGGSSRATGGSSSASGGSSSSGGTTSSSGGNNYSSGGSSSPSGGTAGTEASGGAAGAANPGCTLVAGEQRYVTVISSGRERQYYLSVPQDYDPNRAYPLVFGLHPRDSTGMEARDLLGLEAAAPPGFAVFVYPDASVHNWSDGTTAAAWQNGPATSINGGTEDIDFMRDIPTHLEIVHCLRVSHNFAVGWRWGADFASALGCFAGDLFDAIVPAHGSGPYFLPVASEGDPSCAGAVAEWGFHGHGDDASPFEFGTQVRDFWLGQNTCSTDSTPLTLTGMSSDDECVEYACTGRRTRFCAYTAEVAGNLPVDYFAASVMEFLQDVAAQSP